ncbi:MAG: ARMT1-like domain-containing protein [bacterium]|nr:ARMT1-like domain-containing protein [bacterium]
MKIFPDCIPCLLKQTLTTLQFATEDTDLHIQGLKEVVRIMPSLIELPTPTHIGRVIHNLTKVITCNPDPYKKVKLEHTETALKLYPELILKLKSSTQKPLLTALKIAAAGNTIDFARGKDFDLSKELELTLNKEFKLCDYDRFINDLKKADKILYIGDNAGETVFDKVLIEEINNYRNDRNVFYAVRGLPVINDATYEDALASGISDVAEIVDSGTDAPAALLEYCTPAFHKLFNQSSLIISKGQGNYEGLSESNAPIYFLFKVKCPAIEKSLNATLGDLLFLGNPLSV